ncbi:MAG: hypothetical protein AYK18_16060 [Theionarchaea archaeon DG-70]|nr:MAG: hypothetical protein AYK18_16060 [Theionarchaea archaeon DG-70]
MRLAFLYPPSLPPTSPPCGISYLKAFLGTGRAFDLNLRYHQTAVTMLIEGRLPVEAEIKGYVLEPEHLKKAVDFLKKNNNFYDQAEYNRNATIFLQYFNKIDVYMREECMKHFFEDSAADEVVHFFDHLLHPVIAYHPDVVGFSHMIFSQRDFILALAHHLKREDISIIVGGASLSSTPESYLSPVGARIKKDLSKIFDVAFYGEGELPLKAYLEEESIEKIPNSVYKKGEIIKNKETGVKNLDELPPPDYTDFPLTEYYTPEPVLSLLTSRGCYWRRCTFCIHHKSYYTYRTRSVEKVIDDIKELQKKYNVNYFLFADEMIHPNRFSQLSSEITKEGLNIRCYSEAKPTKEFTADHFKNMYTAGVRALLWGVESGTQRILDLIDKGTNIRDIEQVLKKSCEAGIWNMIFMIIGYPTQTEQEVNQDITFLQKNEPYIYTFAKSLFQLEVGSRICENPEQFRIARVEKNPDPFSSICWYAVSEGLLNKEAALIYGNHPELSNLSKISPHFGKLRDHMLLFADHVSKNPLKD